MANWLEEIGRFISRPERDLKELVRIAGLGMTTKRVEAPDFTTEQLKKLGSSKALGQTKEVQKYKKDSKKSTERYQDIFKPKYLSDAERDEVLDWSRAPKDALIVGSLLMSPAMLGTGFLPAVGSGSIAAGMGSIGGSSKGHEFDTLGRDMALGGIFGGGSHLVSQALRKPMQKLGEKIFEGGKRAESSLKGIKTDKSPYGLTASDRTVGAAEDVVKGRLKLKDKGILGMVRKILSPNNVDESAALINADLDSIISSNKDAHAMSTIANEAAEKLSGPLGISKKAAYSRVVSSLNSAMEALDIKPNNLGQLTTSDLAILKRFLQADDFMQSVGKSTRTINNNAALHKSIYSQLKGSLGDPGKALYKEMDALWGVAPDLMSAYDASMLNTQYYKGIKIPGIASAVSGLGGAASRRVQDIGNMLLKTGEGTGMMSKAANVLPGITAGVASQESTRPEMPPQMDMVQDSAFGSGMAQDPTGEAQDQMPMDPSGWGVAGEAQGMGGSQFNGMQALGASAMQELQPQGGEMMGMPDYWGESTAQQAPQGEQVDWNALYDGLIKAVSNGDISSSDAETIVELAKKRAGIDTSAATNQIAALAQTNPEMARQLLGQALLSGDVDSGMANSISSLYGIDVKDDDKDDEYSQKVLNAMTGLQDLGTMKDIIAQDGVPTTSFGPFGGLSGEAQKYTKAAQNIADIIARSRTGAAMNITEEKLYSNWVPRFTDTKDSREKKMEDLYSLFALVIKNEGIEMEDVKSQMSDISNEYSLWNQ